MVVLLLTPFFNGRSTFNAVKFKIIVPRAHAPLTQQEGNEAEGRAVKFVSAVRKNFAVNKC